MQSRNNLFTVIDCGLFILIAMLSIFTRMYRIAEPAKISFDEVHFGNFTNWYLHQRFHFDIHPPLGKLSMALIAHLTGYKGTIVYGRDRDDNYLPEEHWYVSQRITCGIFSGFVAPCIYIAMRALRFSYTGAFCAALCIAFDITTLVEGTYILSDGALHFFTAIHIAVLCIFLDHPTVLRTLAAGLTLGLACCCKHTALGLIGLDGCIQLVWILFKRPRIPDIIVRGILYLAPAIFGFVGPWIVHFVITPYHGLNWNYFKEPYVQTLVSRKKNLTFYFGNRLIGPGLIERIIEWNKVMSSINTRSKIPHAWESMPIYWPLALDKHVFFQSEGNRRVVCVPNAFDYWFSTVALALTCVAFLLRRADWRNAVCMWGWVVSYIPFVLVPRTMFNYHYIIPLFFAIMNMFALLENALPPAAASLVSIVLLVLVGWCFLYFAPWAYFLDSDTWKERRWVRGWQKGPLKPIHNYDNVFNTTDLMY